MFGLGGLEGLVIALGVLVVVVVLFVLWRMGFLTKKTLPIVGGALAAIGTTAVVREKKRDRLKQEIAAKERELAGREKRLEELKRNAELSEGELAEAKADLERQREEHHKEMLRIDAETAEEKQRIDALSSDELANEFQRVFGSQGRQGGS